MLATGNIKQCPGCNRELPLDAFNKDGARKDGLSTYCKACQAAKNRKWRRNLIATAQGTAITPPSPPDGKQPREIIAEIRERINTLRALGYSFEGKLTYLQTIKL